MKFINLKIFIDMKENQKKTMHELIMEEVNSNPILTEEELKKMIYFPTEEEIQKDEMMTEKICRRIELLLEETSGNPQEEQIRQIILEENNKRNLLQ